MKNKLLVGILFTLVLPGCEQRDPDHQKTIELSQVRLTVPENWRKIPKQGYDSEVGEITNGQTTLQYDYGWYGYAFTKETAATHHRTSTTIDGRAALIVQPRQKGKGVVGLYVQADSLNRFTLIAKDVKNEQSILTIFRSLKVK